VAWRGVLSAGWHRGRASRRLGIARSGEAFAPHRAADAVWPRWSWCTAPSQLASPSRLAPLKHPRLRPRDGREAGWSAWGVGNMYGGRFGASTARAARGCLRTRLGTDPAAQDRRIPADPPIGRSYAPHRLRLWRGTRSIGSAEQPHRNLPVPHQSPGRAHDEARAVSGRHRTMRDAAAAGRELPTTPTVAARRRDCSQARHGEPADGRVVHGRLGRN
jgi:hypothetical protein